MNLNLHRLAGAAVFAVLMAGVCPRASGLPNVVQEHYRWRNDDGSETAATWKADADTPFSKQLRGQNIRLRFVLSNADGLEAARDILPRLEYSTGVTNVFRPVPVTTTREPFQMAESPHYANGSPATKQLAGSGEFQPGVAVEAPMNRTDVLSLGAERYSNFEYCFVATSNALGAATYYFKLTNLGTDFPQYDQYAELTIIGVPEVSNAGGASEVGVTFATLNGQVTETQADVPHVTLFWGPTDGGTLKEAWSHAVAVGEQAGSFSAAVTGLLASATYRYRCYATNLAGGAWASGSASFTTLGAPVRFARASYEAAESGTQIVVSVSKPLASAAEASVAYATADGTATAGDDYEAVSGRLSWAAGETGERTFAIPVPDDGADEPNESVLLLLSAPSNCVVEGAAGAATIVDDDGLPTVQFVSSGSSGDESRTSVSIAVAVTPVSGLDVSVQFAAIGGTASDISDYVLAPGSVTIAAGSPGTNITLTVLDDTEYEADETVTVALSAPSNALTGFRTNWTYTIIDRDPRTPRVDNWKGAGQIYATSAALRGQVLDTGRDDPEVAMYWGPADGGTDEAAWSHRVPIGRLGAATFQTNVAHLVTGTVYYYRCFAENAAGASWAASSENFVALDPPEYMLLSNESLEEPGVTPASAYGWTRVGDQDVERTDAFPRTGASAMAFQSLPNIYFYGSDRNAFRLTWNGQLMGGTVHPSGGVRPGFILSGSAYVRARAVGTDPSTFTYVWRNLDRHTNWMLGSAAVGNATYEEIAMSNANPVAVGDVGDRFVPALQRTTVGTSEEDRFHADDLTMKVSLPRLSLERDPAQPVTFPDVLAGGASEVRLGVRCQGGAPGSVLYGAYISEAGSLTDPAWNGTAWQEVFDPGGAFTIVEGARLAATNDAGYQSATLRFAPTAAGSYTGVVRVATTDPMDYYPGGGKLQGSIVYEQYVLVGTAYAPPVLSVTNIAVREGGEGGAPAVFTVRLAGPVRFEPSFRYATADGSAQAGVHYATAGGTIRLSTNATTVAIPVEVFGDRAPEHDTKAFSLVLSEPENAVLGTPSTATCTIWDDDPQILLLGSRHAPDASLDLLFRGAPGASLVLQQAGSLTGAWNDVEALLPCQPGTNRVQCAEPAEKAFWRLRMAP